MAESMLVLSLQDLVELHSVFVIDLPSIDH